MFDTSVIFFFPFLIVFLSRSVFLRETNPLSLSLMMMMIRRVMCVLAVVLCCACGYTMAAAAAVDNDSPSGRGVSRGAVEVSCGTGGALRVRPA
ncbi:uncharacterized protein TM35_001221020, partial [Trypanosoma theileri]